MTKIKRSYTPSKSWRRRSRKASTRARELLRRRGADEASIERSAAWWREALKQSIVEGFEELQALRDADDRTLH